MITKTAPSSALISRKLKEWGYDKAQWIRPGVSTTQGFMVEKYATHVTIEYYNHGSERHITDAFLTMQFRTLMNMKQNLLDAGFQVTYIKSTFSKLGSLIVEVK